MINRNALEKIERKRTVDIFQALLITLIWKACMLAMHKCVFSLSNTAL
jgi:hypothetical protein